MPGKCGQIDHLSAVHKGPRCRGSPRIFPFPAIAIRTNSEDGSKHSFSQWGSDESNVTKGNPVESQKRSRKGSLPPAVRVCSVSPALSCLIRAIIAAD